MEFYVLVTTNKADLPYGFYIMFLSDEFGMSSLIS